MRRYVVTAHPDLVILGLNKAADTTPQFVSKMRDAHYFGAVVSLATDEFQMPEFDLEAILRGIKGLLQ